MDKANNISFSIVIVNFNMEEFLEDALQSVVRQDYPKELVQLIVIDGGSTDHSVEIIKKYDQYIDYWISEPDKGQSDAFNKGFSHAKHEWLFWLNADDFLLKDALKGLSARMNVMLESKPDLKWFCFDNLMTDVEGVCHRAIYGPDWNGFFMRRLGPQIHSATSVFHKDIYTQSQQFDLRLHYSMDLDLWLQFFTMGYTYRTVHLFAYAIRVNSQSKTFSEGLKYNPSEERRRQSALMWSKYQFRPILKFLPYWKLYKAFTILLPLLFNNLRFRGKQLIWWK